ncbi:MAG: hypothetical protein KGR69_04140 [Verrucomicrobia bacterium]|nr:hypothetical protein [Verrucomicrobiota bacterium]
MSALFPILAAYRATSRAEREKGTYFEELNRADLCYEASHIVIDTSPDLDQGVPEVHLRLPRTVAQGNDDLLFEGQHLRHQFLHRGVTALIPALGPEPVKDPLGGVPLLARHRPVRLEHTADPVGKDVDPRPRFTLCR